MIADTLVSFKNINMSNIDIFLKTVDEKKYKLNTVREGTFSPVASEIKFLNYRVKEEIIPYFVRDLGSFNLNPTPNKMSLWKLITNTGDRHGTLGRGIQVIQLFFKWFNILRLNKLIGLYPAPCAKMNDQSQSYENLLKVWTYVFIIGVFKDTRDEFEQEIL